MAWTKIKIDKELFENIKRCAETAGYCSTEEFIQHAFEKEVDRIRIAEDDEEKVKDRLRGLGYLQ